MRVPFRPGLWPTLFVLASLPVLIGLGVWQLERREWKHALLDRIERNQAAAPMDAADALALPPEDAAWRRVTATGAFDHAGEIHLFATVERTPGFRVIVPFRTAAGALLVDRGFVPQALKESAARAQGRIPGEITIEGTLRPGANPGAFAPVDDPSANRWYTADLAAMAAARGIAPAPPFLVALTAPVPPGGWPRPLPSAPDLPDNHLAYATTWFSFAAILIVIYAAWGRRRAVAAAPSGR